MTDKKKRPDPEAVAAKDEGAKDTSNASADSSTSERPLYLPLTWNDEPKPVADLTHRCAVIVALLDVALLALLAVLVWEVLR